MTKTQQIRFLAFAVIALAGWRLPSEVERHRKDALANEAKENLAGIFTAMKADFGEY